MHVMQSTAPLQLHSRAWRGLRSRVIGEGSLTSGVTHQRERNVMGLRGLTLTLALTPTLTLTLPQLFPLTLPLAHSMCGLDQHT